MRKPYKKLTELQVFKIYSVLRKEIQGTKYGISIVAELDDCLVHLPKHFTTAFATNEDIFKKFQENAAFLRIIGFKDCKFGRVI